MSSNAWEPVIDQDQRDREDRRTRKSDSKIARLAARELARWLGRTIDAHDAWLIFTRLRALVRNGETADEILQRLRS